ncbi:MAG: hypothetical protein CMJ50_09595 [Planctomycetaceae bacterium]|nr:hypothetical protein [Planctomycetaceae bacterium]
MPPARTSRMAWLKIYWVPGRLAWSVRNHGLLATFRRGFRRAAEARRERNLGIRTAGSIDAMTLKSGTECFGYQPIPYAAIEAALKSVQPSTNDVFVDLGCGMGRAVVLAGVGSFRRVIGVEISPELCIVARQNVAHVRRRLRTSAVDIVQADACDYSLPDDATVLLLFNPFDEPVVRRVLDNVRKSLERTPRTLTIIYATPRSRHDVLADVPWLRLHESLRITDEEWLRLGIYRSTKDVP